MYLTEELKEALTKTDQRAEKADICTLRRHYTLALRERNDGLDIEMRRDSSIHASELPDKE